MVENKKISIIVPVYNVRDYLAKCVHSITSQTFTDLEILLVDDGSDDGSGQICDELAGADRRIRVIHKVNGGSSSARNVGIFEAQGEYLGFVDSDDFIEPDMYEKLYKAIRQYHVKAAQAGRDEQDEQGNVLPNFCNPPEKPECIDSEAFLRELLMHRGDCSFCTKLLHRELFNRKAFPEGALNEDFHLLVNMLKEIGRIASLPDQSYHVFCRIGSNTRRGEREDFSKVFWDSVVNADMAADVVAEDYPALQKTAFRFGVFQRLEYLLHIPITQMLKENREYRQVISWLRKNWLNGMLNPYLTVKNKLYHTLFAVLPKGIRVVHKRMKLRDEEDS